MRIVVLVKPVPDTTGQERLGPDLRVDRANVPAVVNANDEYALEAALKLVEAAGEGDVTLLTMAPSAAPETLRKALAMGAQRAFLVSRMAALGWWPPGLPTGPACPTCRMPPGSSPMAIG